MTGLDHLRLRFLLGRVVVCGEMSIKIVSSTYPFFGSRTYKKREKKKLQAAES